jgi:hypothetical protein
VPLLRIGLQDSQEKKAPRLPQHDAAQLLLAWVEGKQDAQIRQLNDHGRIVDPLPIHLRQRCWQS